jgi:SNF2 family DNA or RNA helicase
MQKQVRKLLSRAIAGVSDFSEAATVKPFYGALGADDVGSVDVTSMNVPLLKFQKQGVAWMLRREQRFSGGIMADHLGMGKTVQMIALCLAAGEKDSKRFKGETSSERLSTGFRTISILRQLQHIQPVVSCSKLNRPGRDLHELLNLCGDNGEKADEAVRDEVKKWLSFAGRYHPSYERKALAYLLDEQALSFDVMDSPELRTLVVVPASLMFQWKAEINNKVKSSRQLTVILFHGEAKTASPLELESTDFVITTYDTLTRACEDGGPLLAVRWKRIILDEAHMIRNDSTMRWKAISKLQGLKRWAVTATPLHNGISDLQNLLTFIGSPKLPVVQRGGDEILQDPILQRTIARSIEPLFLRRAPVMIRDGVKEILVHLPEKEDVVRFGDLNDNESKTYNEILARSKASIESHAGGTNHIHVFAMMTRLRQMCCHPWIATRALQVFLCGICHMEASIPIQTRCGHAFCTECLSQKFRDNEAVSPGACRIPCPVCSVPIEEKKAMQTHIGSHQHIASLKAREFETSTKLNMIMLEVDAMLKSSPEDKMIIFSHFTTFLDVISVALDRHDIGHVRLDGTMALPARQAVIKHFQETKQCRVMIASKTASGVGLNITAANFVIIVDPWWNPAIEEQAIHRCYRIGQTKKVYVKRFVISETIEQYCYEISQKKREFGEAILRATTRGESGARVVTSKLEELMQKLKFVVPKAEN